VPEQACNFKLLVHDFASGERTPSQMAPPLCTNSPSLGRFEAPTAPAGGLAAGCVGAFVASLPVAVAMSAMVAV